MFNLPTLQFVKQPFSPGADTYAIYYLAPSWSVNRPIGWVDVDWDEQWHIAANPLNPFKN